MDKLFEMINKISNVEGFWDLLQGAREAQSYEFCAVSALSARVTHYNAIGRSRVTFTPK